MYKHCWFELVIFYCYIPCYIPCCSFILLYYCTDYNFNIPITTKLLNDEHILFQIVCYLLVKKKLDMCCKLFTVTVLTHSMISVPVFYAFSYHQTAFLIIIVLVLKGNKRSFIYSFIYSFIHLFIHSFNLRSEQHPMTLRSCGSHQYQKNCG